jgi:hypothetical protein
MHLSPAIAAACMAASLGVGQGLHRIERSAALFAKLANAVPGGAVTHLSDSALDAYVERFIQAAVRGEFSTEMPGGAVDRSRYWLAVAKALWRGEVRQRLARCRLEVACMHTLASIASAWLNLKVHAFVKVAGVTLRVSGPARRTAWLQAMEWAHGAASRKAVKYLTGYHGEISHCTFSDELLCGQGGDESNPALYGERAIQLAEILLAEASQRASCSPWGSFRITIPEGVFLNVTGLRIWIEPPEKMWGTLEINELLGTSAVWTVSPPHVSRWILPEQAATVFHLVMSALWRDLCVGGERFIDGQAAGKAVVGRPIDGRPPVQFGGHIDWGACLQDLDDQQHLASVRAHLRRLTRNQHPSRRARYLARRAGVTRLPPGMTFVRPHARTRTTHAVFDDVPIQIQGLTKVLRFYAENFHADRSMALRYAEIGYGKSE